MKEHPILFSASMVKAIIDGRKTQTRRVAAALFEYDGDLDQDDWPLVCARESGCLVRAKSPYGVPGDRLWVRETFAANILGCEAQGGYSYRADHRDPRGDGPANPMKWTSPRFMPRKASRLTLEVTGVRVERLQSITDEDALADGITGKHWPTVFDHRTARGAFVELWDSINGKRAAWSSDPWVWVIGFRRLETMAT